MLRWWFGQAEPYTIGQPGELWVEPEGQDERDAGIGFRCRWVASERAYAATSEAAFSAAVSSIASPVPETGCAAPIWVPGAIAAMSAAIVMRKPAEAARAPLGPTYTLSLIHI